LRGVPQFRTPFSIDADEYHSQFWWSTRTEGFAILIATHRPWTLLHHYGALCRMAADSPDKIKARFGEHVRALRKDRSLSQEDFAYLCGLDRTYVGAVERGERNVSLVNIGKIAAGMGLPIRDLFEFEHARRNRRS
jgi:DNA-binding XRE family transcriptional regulator